MSEWKPGNILADVRGHIFFCIEVSENTRTAWKSGACLVSPDGNGVKAEWLQGLRRLAVIDYEDEDAVLRLAEAYRSVDHRIGTAPLAAALREFARPSPQKPPEPNGLGGLIRDEHDQLWTRAAWGWVCLTQMLPRAQWSDFTSVSIVEADS